MKTTFMQIIFGIGIILSSLFSSCDQLPTIDENDVMLDSANYYVSKATGERITGIIQDKYCTSSGDSILAKKRSKDGIVEEWITYYADGQVCGKYYMSTDRINKKVKSELFTKTGDLKAIYEYDEKDRTKNKTEYREGSVTISFTWDYEKNRVLSKKYVQGKQVNEQVNDLKDRLLEYYDVDKNGNKIDALRSCGVELVAYETGYYGIFLNCPTIILKLKNVSGGPLTSQVCISANFIKGDEDWGSDVECAQWGWSSTPWLDGVIKQIDLDGRHLKGKAEIICQLYVNGRFYKTIQIQNKELKSNRIE